MWRSAYNHRVPRVLLLTGPGGSGKTTISTLLAARAGWTRIAEDDIWPRLFGKNRGAFGSDEHRRKRAAIHAEVQQSVLAALAQARNVVIDATVHEAPPEAFREYEEFFRRHGIAWELRVLMPRLEIAVARDAGRNSWHLGAGRVADLYSKFTGAVFSREVFVDNSDESPQTSVIRICENWL